MRAALFVEPHRVEPGERPDPVIVEPTDAIVRVVLACVCGSDLWYYRGDSPFEPGPIGHEFIGVVEDVGADVRHVGKGDFVIAPFAFSDGTCPHCRHGIKDAGSAQAPAPRSGSSATTTVPRPGCSGLAGSRRWRPGVAKATAELGVRHAAERIAALGGVIETRPAEDGVAVEAHLSCAS